MRAPGLKRDAEQRRRGSSRSIAKCVRASRGSSESIDISTRSRRSRPIGASIVPLRAGGVPTTSARYSRRSVRSAISALSARCAGSLLATTSSPEVSRSSRWTMPAPPRLLTAGATAGERLRRACRCGVRGRDGRRAPAACRRSAGSSSSNTTVNGTAGSDASAPIRSSPSGPADDDALAGTDRVALRPTGAVDVDMTGLDPLLGARAGPRRGGEELVEPQTRRPSVDLELEVNAAPSAARHHRRTSFLTPTRPLEDPQEREHADRDRHVGDVERRPVGQLDEVGDRPVRDAIDEVADGAADEQTGRQPQPRPIGSRSPGSRRAARARAA